MIRYVSVLAAVLLFSSISYSQEDAQRVLLPDEIMRQVVGRILTYQFKPRRTSVTIPLAVSQVKHDWLPEIKNIRFELVQDQQVIEHKRGVFLLEPIEREGTMFSINVGWGDLNCDGSGDTWKFRVKSGKVQLWPSGGWGRGCGGYGSDPPFIRGLKLGDLSANELPGYEFFKKGRLKDIRLGISTREDMRRIFGSDCEGGCDYDRNWSIRAEYISDGLAWTTTVGNAKSEYSAKEEFVGKLGSLSLRPVKPISFRSLTLPSRIFASGKLMSIGDAWGLNGFEGAVHNSYNVYSDGYGLQYTIYDEETFNNLKKKTQEQPKRRKGDLIEIEYSIPDSLKENVYRERSVHEDNKPTSHSPQSKLT